MGIGGKFRQHFLADDGGRHVPIGIDDQKFHRVGENGRRGFLLADDDARALDHLSVVDDDGFIIGDIHFDVFFAEVARHPAPAFHIGDDLGFETRRRLAARQGRDGARRQMTRRRQTVRFLKIGDRRRDLRVIDQILTSGASESSRLSRARRSGTRQSRMPGRRTRPAGIAGSCTPAVRPWRNWSSFSRSST